MTGGLMQLVAYGAQDIYLTGNPMITYFKVVYRRHTNFAMESIQQTFNGNATFGSRVTCLISRNGDLVSGITLEATLPAAQDGNTYVDDVGHHLIQQVDVDIGGQLIDRHYSDWLEIWAQLTVPAGHEEGYRKMIGQSQTVGTGVAAGLQMADAGFGAQSTNAQDRKVYVPLQFWFCRNVGLALPLIALQYHEVKVTVQFASATSLVISEPYDGAAPAAPTVVTAYTDGAAGTAPTDQLTASLWVDYIYLDTDERRRFAQVSHEYLIEQLQFSGDEAYGASPSNLPITLNFNHPVKELVWVAKETTRLPRGNVLTRNALGITTRVTPTVVSSVNEHSNYTDISGLSYEGAAAIAVAASAARTTNTVTVTTAQAHGLAVGNLVTTAFADATLDITAGTILAVPTLTTFTYTKAGANVAGPNVGTVTFQGTDGTGTTAIDNADLASSTLHKNPSSANVLARNPVLTAKLQLNGHDRFTTRDGTYFNRMQTRCHTRIPQSPGINVYSFALKPEDHQPSGSCNFSRIDNARLILSLSSSLRGGNVKVFATNYNVLRIMSGMGGLAYSN
jgi:hypothetical protein